MPDRSPLTFISEAETRLPSEEFTRLCVNFGIELTPDEIKRLGLFLDLLLKNNERMNLTAIKEPDAAWRKHIFDGLTPICVLHDLPAGAKLVDLGSGSGVPAIPLAIVMPQVQFTLVESTRKKARYLQMLSEVLGLPQVQVISERIETVGQDPRYREQFDAVSARALGHLRILTEFSLPLLKLGGKGVFIKGGRADEETLEAKRALHMLHARHETHIATPTGTITVLSKVAATPKKYPRAVGEPKRSPL
ncbi:MAG: 16S rRNA (guanine(527)-N(7))-methyltransferase RsmG [Myxococcales bacterium]|nr:16S rRNA (guanine(527)-N(7))-methyltransferase RsmG [Myxococcales bacterium]